jgi:predicted acetyltransferase
MVQNKDIDYYTNPIVLIAFLQDNDVTTDIDKSIYCRRNKTFQVSYIYKGHYL